MVSILVAHVVGSGGELVDEFSTVPDALSRAQQIQRGDGSGARIGIAGGDDPDPRLVATALSARAEPGQVLISQPARSLALAAGGYEFREVGPVDLDAAAGAPVKAWELLWKEPQVRTKVRLCGPLQTATS
jgi:hypothetical protein